jgi:DnaK suppressor protein
MESKTVAKYKELLLRERKRLLHHANDRTESEFVLSQEDLPDETDLAASENQQSLTLSLRDREYKLLVKIEKALEKIQEGVFGICEECEEEIETRRLEARPMSHLCVSCQEQEEHQEKIYA